MTKKLKIRFTKFEKALAMQILEQEGSFRNSAHIQIGIPELCEDDIYLCEEDERDNLRIYTRYFSTNDNRDEYLKNVIRWISKEQFGAGSSELKIGEMCEVSDDGVSWHKYRLLAILPDRYEMRFIIENGTLSWCTCTYARPIVKRTEPKIDGDIYTWEK